MKQQPSKKICLFYLARHAESLKPMQEFKASYLRYAPGIDHDLLIIYKGFESGAQRQQARDVFGDVIHSGIDLPDSGFDIGSYIAATMTVQHEFVCYLNTFSQVTSDNWLATLFRYASLPDVGISGATASYESIHDTMRLLRSVIWLCNVDHIPYDPKIASYYGFLVDKFCTEWKHSADAAKAGSRLKSIMWKLRMGNKEKRRQRILQQHLRQRWADYTKEGEHMSRLRRFPCFPNPHVRSNGFMVRRSHILQARRPELHDKLDACEFESGEDSLTTQLRKKGLRAVLVSRLGTGYEVGDWSRSLTFRLGDQSGLLISDNRTRDFAHMNGSARATHVWVTWGDYFGPPPRDLPRLGYSFAIDRAVTDPQPVAAAPAATTRIR